MSSTEPGILVRRDCPASILVVDQDPLMLTAIGAVLNMQGHRAVLARDERVALASIASGEHDVVILSIDELNSGCELTERLRSTSATAEIPIIFLVPELSVAWRSRLSEHGGVFSMLKPIEPEDLIELVDKVLWLPHVARSRLGAGGHHLAAQSDWISLDEQGF